MLLPMALFRSFLGPSSVEHRKTLAAVWASVVREHAAYKALYSVGSLVGG